MRHTKNRHLFAFGALIAALAIAPETLAQPADSPAPTEAESTAAQHAQRAKVAYDLQDWAIAEREYHEAYRLDQKSDYLWGLAQVQRLSGQYSASIKSYRAFQRSGVSASQANAAEMMVVKAEADLAKEEARKAEESRRQAPRPDSGPAPTAAQPAQARTAPTRGFGLFIAAATITVGAGAVASVGDRHLTRQRLRDRSHPRRLQRRHQARDAHQLPGRHRGGGVDTAISRPSPTGPEGRTTGRGRSWAAVGPEGGAPSYRSLRSSHPNRPRHGAIAMTSLEPACPPPDGAPRRRPPRPAATFDPALYKRMRTPAARGPAPRAPAARPPAAPAAPCRPTGRPWSTGAPTPRSCS